MGWTSASTGCCSVRQRRARWVVAAKTVKEGAAAAAELAWAVTAPAPPSTEDRRPEEPQTLTFSDEERWAAWTLSGYNVASAGQQQPLAIWIIGPSAVGKSTLATDVAPSLGVPRRLAQGPLQRPAPAPAPAPGAPDSRHLALDAVVVDGAFFRQVHGTYQDLAKSEDWASAYPLLKRAINREKQDLLKAVAGERKHLIIPETCQNLDACLSTVAELARMGYTSHVLAVIAPRDEVARRGRARERSEGKRYAPAEFDRSVAAFAPLISACNGRYQVLRVIQPEDSGSSNGAKCGGGGEGEGGATNQAGGECGPWPRLECEVLGSGIGGRKPNLPADISN